MTIFIDKTGQLTQGTSGADSIIFQSAAIQGSTVQGLGGNDTINIAEASTDASANGASVLGGAGDDSIFIASADYSARQTIIRGGAGNDTITLSGGSYSLIKGNENADLLSAAKLGNASAIIMGGGKDTVHLQQGTAQLINLGGGRDLISASGLNLETGASVIGGGGKDTITLDISANTAVVILGDKGEASPGQDSIDIEFDGGSNSRIKGQGGADTIVISGAGASAFIAGGEGADSIILSGSIGDDVSVRGGGGNDTIFIEGGITSAESASFAGGSGNDSIKVFTDLDLSGDYSNLRYRGGAGADSIEISGGTYDAADIGTFDFSSLSDSNISAGFDVVNLGSNGGTDLSGASAEFSFAGFSAKVVTQTDASSQVLFGDTTNYAGISTGEVTLNGSLSVSSVTAIAGTVDTLTVGEGAGTVALVTASGGKQYLFVQGGTAGIADDAVINLAGIKYEEGDAFAIATTATINFSGAL